MQTTSPGGNSGYIKHDDSDDLVVVAPVTADSSSTDKQDATFVEAADWPARVASPESVNKPGGYLRHQFPVPLQPNDGGSLFAMDATFCPGTGAGAVRASPPVGGLPGGFIRSFSNATAAAGGGSSPDTAGWRSTRPGWCHALGPGAGGNGGGN